ncbi:MAG: hypothetical protein ACK4ND_09200 [Cytophagaceae bacterium]
MSQKIIVNIWKIFSVDGPVDRKEFAMKRMTFPEDKKFAFTIFDDTDHARVENVKPVYEPA